jgi:alpha-L-rhamnosidase
MDAKRLVMLFKMSRRILVIVLLCLGWISSAKLAAHNTAPGAIMPVQLRCEYMINPMGIDMPDPRFYWQLSSSVNGELQTAYELIVSSNRKYLSRNRGDMLSSGKVTSAENTHIVYNGNSLQPATTYYWKVRVWGRNNKVSPWSDTATFTTGLFNESDWKGAQWIAWRAQDEWETEWWRKKEIEQKCTELYLPAYFGARMSMFERYHFHNHKPYDPAPLYRKQIDLVKHVKSAKAFISGIGYYELYINGQRIGDHVLDPGWTNYKKTILYATYDVSNYFQQGENVIGVMLGRGNYGMTAIDHWDFWQKWGYIGQPKLKCRFQITYTDGSTDDVVSDLQWKVTGGPVLFDCPHMGEIYDATKEIEGWNKTGFDDSIWDDAKPACSPGGKMAAQLCQPIKIVRTFKPVDLGYSDFGSQWIDAGTNMAGWVRLKISESRGTRIAIYYGENIDPMDHNQPGGYQQMAYIAKGEPGEIAQCRFSYKGFRYVLVKGLTKPLSKEDIEICQVNSDVPLVGSFSSSDSTLNGIHRISVKAMVSNLHSIPTDCPHREKNGWMGDATTGIEFGMVNFDLAALLTKYIRDIFDTQDENGRLSTIAPSNDYTKGLSPLWSSACVHLPWYIYHYYGDTRLFNLYWDKMKLFAQSVWEYNGVEGKEGIFTDVLADWCSPHGNISSEGPEIYTTMKFFLVLNRLSLIAEIIGKPYDAMEYKKQAEIVRNAIYKHCFDEENMRFGGINPSGYRQGPNAMALQYNIVKDEHRESVLNGLLHNIAVDRNYSFYGGIFTGHALWELIPQSGNAELAYIVAVNDAFPGFAYMLKNGATTLWEHWEDVASHIHYFMGFVNNFFYRHLAGINYDERQSGFRHIIFKPEFVPQLDHVSHTYNSIQGEIGAQWIKLKDNQYSYKITIPPNTTGTLIYKGTEKHLGSGKHVFSFNQEL